MAIAPDATAENTVNPGASNSYSHTFSGSNRIVFIEAFAYNVGSVVTISTVTVAGNNATQLGGQNYSFSGIGINYVFAYYVNPPLGAQTIQITTVGSVSTTYLIGRSASYTGVDQVSPVTNTGTTRDTSGTLSLYGPTLTPSGGGNQWGVALIENHSVVQTASSGTYRVGIGNGDGLFDTNGNISGSALVEASSGGTTGIPWSYTWATFVEAATGTTWPGYTAPFGWK